jgi:hypothetical protein
VEKKKAKKKKNNAIHKRPSKLTIGGMCHVPKKKKESTKQKKDSRVLK